VVLPSDVDEVDGDAPVLNKEVVVDNVQDSSSDKDETSKPSVAQVTASESTLDNKSKKKMLLEVFMNKKLLAIPPSHASLDINDPQQITLFALSSTISSAVEESKKSVHKISQLSRDVLSANSTAIGNKHLADVAIKEKVELMAENAKLKNLVKKKEEDFNEFRKILVSSKSVLMENNAKINMMTESTANMSVTLNRLASRRSSSNKRTWAQIVDENIPSSIFLKDIYTVHKASGSSVSLFLPDSIYTIVTKSYLVEPDKSVLGDLSGVHIHNTGETLEGLFNKMLTTCTQEESTQTLHTVIIWGPGDPDVNLHPKVLRSALKRWKEDVCEILEMGTSVAARVVLIIPPTHHMEIKSREESRSEIVDLAKKVSDSSDTVNIPVGIVDGNYLVKSDGARLANVKQQDKIVLVDDEYFAVAFTEEDKATSSYGVFRCLYGGLNTLRPNPITGFCSTCGAECKEDKCRRMGKAGSDADVFINKAKQINKLKGKRPIEEVDDEGTTGFPAKKK
jgi:hypothetical protein